MVVRVTVIQKFVNKKGKLVSAGDSSRTILELASPKVEFQSLPSRSFQGAMPRIGSRGWVPLPDRSRSDGNRMDRLVQNSRGLLPGGLLRAVTNATIRVVVVLGICQFSLPGQAGLVGARTYRMDTDTYVLRPLKQDHGLFQFITTTLDLEPQGRAELMGIYASRDKERRWKYTVPGRGKGSSGAFDIVVSVNVVQSFLDNSGHPAEAGKSARFELKLSDFNDGLTLSFPEDPPEQMRKGKSEFGDQSLDKLQPIPTR